MTFVNVKIQASLSRRFLFIFRHFNRFQYLYRFSGNFPAFTIADIKQKSPPHHAKGLFIFMGTGI